MPVRAPPPQRIGGCSYSRRSDRWWLCSRTGFRGTSGGDWETPGRRAAQTPEAPPGIWSRRAAGRWTSHGEESGRSTFRSSPGPPFYDQMATTPARSAAPGCSTACSPDRPGTARRNGSRCSPSSSSLIAIRLARIGQIRVRLELVGLTEGLLERRVPARLEGRQRSE